ALTASKQANEDAYLRIVETRDDGIVVRGAKVHTSVSVNANEMIVLPTRAMGADDAAYAVAFAVPLDTPGLRLVASPFLSTKGKTEAEYPLSAERKMVETCTLFDDVFVPADRVFLAGPHEYAGELAPYPAPEDLDHPEYGVALQRYLEASGGASGGERLRVMNLISDLTTGEYGGYQAVLAIHAEGSIEAEKLTILAQYERERAIE